MKLSSDLKIAFRNDRLPVVDFFEYMAFLKQEAEAEEAFNKAWDAYHESIWCVMPNRVEVSNNSRVVCSNTILTNL